MKPILLLALTLTLPLAPRAARAQEGAPQTKAFSTARVGVNLAGGEFGDDKLPGVYDQQYTYPSARTLDLYAARKRTSIRLPFKWERVQRSLGAPLDNAEIARIRGVLRAAGERHMDVILDVHNYGRYRFVGEDHAEIIVRAASRPPTSPICGANWRRHCGANRRFMVTV